MDFDLVHLWGTMSGLVKGVVIMLTIQALASIAVVVDRLILLALSNKRSKVFAKEAGRKLAGGEYDTVVKISKEHEGSHLANFIETGLSVFLARRNDGIDREKSAELANRALERRGEQLSLSLNRGMNILASTGSTAPFIGLLGTVLGILNTFKTMSAEGGGGLDTIGAQIGEALIVTGYGLMVAIPTVLLFNFLSGKIARYEAGLANAGSELIDQLEAGSTTTDRISETELKTCAEPTPAVA